MKKLIALFFLLSLPLIYLNYAHANPVEQMAQRISTMDITSYKLRWMIHVNNEWEFLNIYSGNDKEICDQIKNSFDDIMIKDSFTSENIGILTLIGNNDQKEEIYITSPGFVPEDGRKSFQGFFVSSKLAEVIKFMIADSEYKDRIPIPENIFQNLANLSEKGPAPGNKVCGNDSECEWISGWPVKIGGCGCFHKAYIMSMQEYGNLNEDPIQECEPPPHIEKPCICSNNECQVNL